MRYLDLKRRFASFSLFSLQDIKNVDSNFYLARLSEWQHKGYLTKIIKGKYMFTDLLITEEVQFVIANTLLTPSYISLEMALSWYGLIPEGVYQITSVSTRKTAKYHTSVGNYNYQKIKKETFFGYNFVSMPQGGKRYKIATVEKAILDFLYLHSNINSLDAIAELRLNMEIIKEKVDLKKLAKQATYFKNKSLETRVDKFIEYCHNA